MKKVLVLISVLLMLAALGGCAQNEAQSGETVYHVYFGLNDADSGRQELGMEEASAQIRKIIEGHGYGYTEYRAYGAYMDNGAAVGNDTLVYMLVFITDEAVKNIADDVIEALNLASVLCLEGPQQSGFFVGEQMRQ